MSFVVRGEFNYTNLLSLSALIFLCLGIFLAFFNIWSPYSYWWDELYSVTGATLPMTEMFSKYIISDVHPPLYQLILRVWIDLFGTSELATRSLSLLFSLLATLVFSCWSLKNLPVRFSTVSVMIFSTHFLFSFYSQETRSYAMTLFLSTTLTAMTLTFINGKRSAVAALALSIGALLLSLTHFFGLLFADLVLFQLFLVTKSNRLKAIFLFFALATLLWPITHFSFGSLTSKLGGNFWIRSEGIHSTLHIFFKALIPQAVDGQLFLSEDVAAILLSTIGTIVTFGLAIHVYKLLNTYREPFRQEVLRTFRFASLFLLQFLFCISMIDLYTPISTTRNLIVLLPIFSIFLSFLFYSVYHTRWLHFTLVALFCLTSLRFSFLKLRSKQRPIENHSEASRFIIERGFLGTHTLYYYLAIPRTGMLEPQKLMARFYLERFGGQAYHAIPIDSKDVPLLGTAGSFVLLGQHSIINTEELMIEFRKSGLNVGYFEPNQEKKGSVFVIYTK